MDEKNIKLQYAGSFTSITDNNKSHYQYDIDTLNPGINFQDKHILKLSTNKNVEWVVSRICDHASGTLESCENNRFAQCPLHGWKLDLDVLRYSNVSVEKKKLTFNIENNHVVVQQSKTHLKLPQDVFSSQQQLDLEIRFLSHACLLFTCGPIKIITDPWLQGPCFLNSW